MRRNASTAISNRCPFFEAQQAELRLPNRDEPLPLRVTYCHLAEEMKRRIETVPEGAALAQMFTVRPRDMPARMFCGPDMEPPTELECTRERLAAHCTPTYMRLLGAFDLDTVLPEEPL